MMVRHFVQTFKGVQMDLKQLNRFSSYIRTGKTVVTSTPVMSTAFMHTQDETSHRTIVDMPKNYYFAKFTMAVIVTVLAYLLTDACVDVFLNEWYIYLAGLWVVALGSIHACVEDQSARNHKRKRDYYKLLEELWAGRLRLNITLKAGERLYTIQELTTENEVFVFGHHLVTGEIVIYERFSESTSDDIYTAKELVPAITMMYGEL